MCTRFGIFVPNFSMLFMINCSTGTLKYRVSTPTDSLDNCFLYQGCYFIYYKVALLLGFVISIFYSKSLASFDTQEGAL